MSYCIFSENTIFPHSTGKKFNEVISLFRGKIIFAILLSVAIGFAACTSKKAQDNIPFFPHEEVKMSSSLFKSYKAIQLQCTGRESIIGEINRLMFSSEKLFVLDRKGNHLVCFNKNGEFVAATDRYIGHANNEYIHLTDAVMDDVEERIYIYCDSPSRLLVFDFDLNLMSAYDVGFFAHEISLDGKNLIFEIMTPEQDGVELIALDKSDITAQPKTLISDSPVVLGLRGLGRTLCSDPQGCLACMPYSPDIIRIKNGVITERYTIDFKDDWFNNSNMNDMTDFIKKNDNKVWMIQNMTIIGKQIIFNTNRSPFYILDLEKRICDSYLLFQNELMPFISSTVIPTQGLQESVVFQIYPGRVNSFLKNVRRQDCNQHNEEVLNLAQNQQKWDNPLVVIWKAE